MVHVCGLLSMRQTIHTARNMSRTWTHSPLFFYLLFRKITPQTRIMRQEKAKRPIQRTAIPDSGPREKSQTSSFQVFPVSSRIQTTELQAFPVNSKAQVKDCHALVVKVSAQERDLQVLVVKVELQVKLCQDLVISP